MYRNTWRTLLAVALVAAGSLVSPSSADAAISGTGLNCYGGFVGVGSTWANGETASLVVKCSASVMPTNYATWLASECGSGNLSSLYMNLMRTTGSDLSASPLTQDLCGNGGSYYTVLGVGFAYGDLHHEGGVISGNVEGYPANYFSITITVSLSGLGSTQFSRVSSFGFSNNEPWLAQESSGRFWSPGPVDQPCATPECDQFHETWPEEFSGFEGWPAALCEEYGVVWEPSSSTILAAGERQRVTLTAPHAQWDEVHLEYSWDWGRDPLNGWEPTAKSAVYSAPRVVSRSILSITIETAAVPFARSNEQFHVRCTPDDPLQDQVFYRRAYGDLSTSIGPERRSCYYVRAQFSGPVSHDWDDVRRVRVWVDDERVEVGGGILDLDYAWRPHEGNRVVLDATLDGDALPWDAPAEAEFEVDATGLLGGTAGVQYLRCEDAEGYLFVEAKGARPSTTADTGGSGDGEVEGGTGGVGGETPPPGGGSTGDGGSVSGDPEPGAVGGVGPGAVGDGAGDGATCFDSAGWSLWNPASWVIGAIKVAACYVRALVVPDVAALRDRWDSLVELVQGKTPFSWFFDGLEVIDGTLNGLDSSIASHSQDCWEWSVQFGDAEAETAEICPYKTVENVNDWELLRTLLGHAVWLGWGFFVMQAAGRLWGMGSTQTYYVNASNPGASAVDW